MNHPFFLIVALGAGSLLTTACTPEGCLGDDADCVLASPCEGLAFTCDGGMTEVYVLAPGEGIGTGPNVLASAGDFVLANDQVVAVIDALDHPHYLGPAGGGLLDLYARGGTDSLRHVYQVAGLLPGEAALYEQARILDEGDVKAVQFLGALDGHPEFRIATRYEVRPCEPGIRVRTELINEGADAESWTLQDGWYFGGRESLPFLPYPGMGFDYPSFGLSTIADAVREVPFMANGAHAEPATSYATIACDIEETASFISDDVSGAGRPAEIVMPRDWRAYERFIAVADGPSVAGATDIALEVRDQLFGEEYTEISGRIIAPSGPSMVSTGLRASVVISEGTEGTPVKDRIPWSHVEPAADGAFSARVPTDRSYLVEVESYGRRVVASEVEVGESPVDTGDVEIPGVGELTINATVDGVEDHVLVLVLPADDETDAATRGKMFGRFDECAPLLGNPHGNSPACNRVLVTGPTTLSVPPGTYDLYATAGPFATLARETEVTVTAGEGQSIELEIEHLDLQPPGTLSGDFHVHGAASFDAQMGDYDRVRTFLATGVQVLVSTEHDVVSNYQEAMEALGAYDRMEMVEGTESTGHILFNFVPEDPNPKVIGHWNFWPLVYDPDAPWRGSAWDEKAEPGLLMTRMAAEGWDPETGICQLNHPLSALQLGRANGWIDSLEIDGNMPLKAEFDGTGQSIFLHTPEGSDFSNADYHVQEVMNGTNNLDYLKYREFWFYLLDQGFFRAATGNSDSHTLTENVVGTPRNLVWTETTLDDFDVEVFDQAIREGRILPTNGPVVLVETTDATSTVRTPSLEVFEPEAGGDLAITVSAAPWVPVEEVRIFVNGEQVHTLTDLPEPAEPFGSNPADFLRLDTTIPLADLLPGAGDAWLVVEAGTPHREAADLNCDSFPDTTDNNGDGVIDWRDVEELDEDPEESCLEDVGPLEVPETPQDREDPLYWFAAVTPDGYPLAVTNPFILDLDGGGFNPVMR
ncbi:MAG: CehA/McbA family metallohydrolase [Deltaproteobacteria bacterium]|nr:CehA/McbA family metallohydrolase [Deltaproteobacteria bacterium]MBW2255335.1 CehA/McbA family metallohydrolase [Deltaproteobacteria bacterium]